MEIQWIGIAFLLGLVARRLGQPPLLGFLAAGFGLELLDLRPDASLIELAHVGILLLLFTIGLKLDLRSLRSRHVLGTSALHLLISTGVLLFVIAGVAAAGAGLGLDLQAVDHRLCARQLRAEGYRGPLAATARFADEVAVLRAEGADVAFEVLADAGVAFAARALEVASLPLPKSMVERRTECTKLPMC